MRKATIAMLLLLVISIGGVCVAAAGVHAPHDQVILTENVIYGDSSAANGLEVQTHVTWNNHLFWDTTLLAGAENSVDTDFRFSAVRETYDRPSEGLGILLENMMDFYYDPLKTEEEHQGIDRAYYELVQTVGAGEEKQTTVHLRDYMKTYPIQVTIDLPGIAAASNMWDANSKVQEQYTEILRDIRCLQEYFVIPVLEDETYMFSVGKDENGNVDFGSGGPGDGDAFVLDMVNAVSDDACYFTFNTRSWMGQIVDTSRLPDGYGLFRVMYGASHDEGEPVVIEEMDIGEPEMVYALDPGVHIENLYLSDDQSLLYLLTQEDNVLYLTTIDCATMDALQKLEIYDFGEELGTIHEIRQRENCWVLWLRSGVLVLLEKLSNGLMEMEYVTTYDFEEIPEYAMSIYTEANWDGERLAIVDKAYNGRIDEEGYYVVDNDTCGFWLLVYDEHGELVYAGNYESGLSDPNERPNNSCGLIWPGPPFTVNWKEE